MKLSALLSPGLITAASILTLASCGQSPAGSTTAPAEPSQANRGSADLEPLKLQLPPPDYEGTPVGSLVGIPLEPPHKGPRPEILIPKGCQNLAFKKKATVSDEFFIVGNEAMITDGDKSFGNYLEMGQGLQYVQIDLEKSQEIYALAVWHYLRNPRAYKCVIAQLSDDKDFKTGVTTVFNNDFDNSSGLGVGSDKCYIESYEGKLIPVAGVRARYVRLYSKGNSADDNNQIIEAEVWGLPAK